MCADYKLTNKKMNETLRRYLLSSSTTFLTAFFGSLAFQIGNGMSIQFTGAFVLSLLSVAVRAGIKVLVESGVGQHADPTV